MDVKGEELAARVNSLANEIAELRMREFEVVLVSSGTVGAGMC